MARRFAGPGGSGLGPESLSGGLVGRRDPSRLPGSGLLLCYAIGLMGVLTPYATGPAPIYFAARYISRPAFWTLGGVFGAFFLLVLLVLGVPWLLSGIP